MKKLIITILLLATTSLAQTTVTFKTANLQKGKGTDNLINYSRQVNTLAGVDLIAVQERNSSDTGWDASLASNGLQEAVYLENAPSQGDGPAIWYRTSTVTVQQVYSKALTTGTNPSCGVANLGWDCSTDVRKSAVAAKVTVSSRQFYVVSTHLCWSACADSNGSLFSVQRVSQANDLVSWISATLTGNLPIIVLGDLNLTRDMPKSPSGFQLDVFTGAGYTDLWAAGITAGTATANWGDRNSDGQPDMPLGTTTTRTHDTRGIDYALTKGTGITLTSINLPDLRATCPHGLVAGGTFPSCSPEVAGGTGVSGQQWDIPEDFGVRPSDHNWLTITITLSTPSVNRGHMRGHMILRKGVIR